MTDKEFIKLLVTVKKETHKRFGKKICKELDADCYSCKAMIMIAYINSLIDVLDE